MTGNPAGSRASVGTLFWRAGRHLAIFLGQGARLGGGLR